MKRRREFDAIIVGGGPAGLSAALVLGRCRRRVLISDAGHPRNERSKAMHGFLSRDGISPAEFARISRAQLRTYPNVTFRRVEVACVRRDACGFAVTMRDGTRESSRTLLLATGIVDELPQIPGLSRLYARSVHHCPYCDGWEHRDQPLAVLGGTENAAQLALELLVWSRDVVLCTNGPATFTPERWRKVTSHDIPVIEGAVKSLKGKGDALQGIRFKDGSFLRRTALFFSPGQHQRSSLAEQLGCKFCDDCSIECGEHTETCVPGVFAAGNASRGLQLVIIAAAEGTRAAFAINERLCEQELAAK